MRPITRSTLATAIEYAAQSKLRPLERQRFFLHKDSGAHRYPDDVMEEARRQAMEIFFQYRAHGPLPKEAQDRLFDLAAGLRSARL
jgi:hypothetical protein